MSVNRRRNNPRQPGEKRVHTQKELMVTNGQGESLSVITGKGFPTISSDDEIYFILIDSDGKPYLDLHDEPKEYEDGNIDILDLDEDDETNGAWDNLHYL